MGLPKKAADSVGGKEFWIGRDFGTIRCDQDRDPAQRYCPSLMRSKPSFRAMAGGVTVKLSLYF